MNLNFRGYPMQILSELKRSEINWSLSYFYDLGYEVKFGDEGNGYKASAQNFDTLIEAIEWLKKQVLIHYPDSHFAKQMNLGNN